MENVKPINHLTDMHYSQPGLTRQIMTTKQVKETLLGTSNFVMACGRNWKLKIKNLGVGMKEVSLTPFD